MYFKRLDMHGFKSFAEPVSLEFLDGMTCIVGPNGSGKSNIADAIKWVLGEQSPKSLRGGKMEEVIFAGTENRKARGIAEVTLVIDNKDGILPIEYNEVAITRKMYRSGESEYSINNRPCRLKDIKELIMDTGMGVDGYSMIGQGKISEIVNNKAEGRRALFEEAAGIVKYRSRKSDAERKMSNASGNLDRVNDILSEIEGRIGTLREDSIKAKEYIVLRDKFKMLEINLAIRQLDTIEERISSMKEDLSEIEQNTERYTTEKEETLFELGTLKQKASDFETELEDVRNRLMQKLEWINSCKNSIEVSEEKLSSIEKDIARTEEEILRDKERIQEEESGIISLEGHLAETEKKYEDKLAIIDEREAAFSEASGKVSDVLGAIEKKKSAVFELYSGISVGKTEISGLQSMVEGLEKRAEKLAEDLSASNEILNQLDKQRQEQEDRERSLTQKVDEYRYVLEDLGQQKSGLEEEKQELNAEYTELSNKLHKASTKKDLLVGFENSYEGFGYAVKYIMNNRRRLRGIHGVAGDLMDVPAGYEVAIQTALGGGLQNIVCDDDSCAAECIRLLKQEKAGRATFLPVSSIKGGKSAANSRESMQLRMEDGFLGFAVELVGYQDRYARIMEYLLGRTAVADSLESAIRLSKKYYSGIRFVTLEGEDINPSGAITGGKSKSNAPNMFERKNEIKALEEEISLNQKELAAVGDRLKDNAAELADVIKDLSKQEAKTEEAEKRLARLTANMNMEESRHKMISDNVSKDNKEKLEIDEEIRETEKMIRQLQADVDSKMAQMAENEGFVDDETRLYDEAKEEMDSIQEEINSLKIDLSAMESDKRHNEDNIRRVRLELKRLEDELASKEKYRDNLLRLNEETGQSIVELKNRLEGLRGDYDSLNRNSDELKEKKEETSIRLTELDDIKRNLEEKINKNQSSKYEIEIKIAKSETQSEGIISRLWDNFDVTPVEAQTMRIEDFAVGAATRESREIKGRMQELEPVNIGAIEEYKQVSERFEFLSEQKEDLLKAIDSLQGIIVDMDKKIKARFMQSFDEISKEFKKTFVELFGGGTAELKLENSENVLESVIEIIAQPPGKKLQNINLMSGGEKTLTGIALVCSILKIRPTPFCILDEVEAALDDVNIGRFVEYLKGFENIQFIVVTHQKVTMEKADVMYGITMPEKGISKVVSLKMKN